eukprot:TRINITY_DN1070_c0_g1_i1.p1 TRINITY_DN1070_c0_g1~~TRINITY_DN1070_c0_g1_i1.p1  ORF type:complete len:126 (+),score=29.26 TRINITY_DN1070_c0_g1_i1:201-578(+)
MADEGGDEIICIDELNDITGGDAEIAEEILKSFMQQIPEDIGTLKRFLARDLRMEAEVQAHTIKGAARSVAAKRLQTLAFTIEIACKDGNVTEATDTLQQLDIVVSETVEAIQAELDKMAATANK